MDGAALVDAACAAEADGDPFLGTTLADRFVVLGRLGAGATGTVYRARDEAAGVDVALKILRAERASDAGARARFLREAEVMRRLRSPHAVRVIAVGEVPEIAGDELSPRGNALFLAMELLVGEPLGARLRRRGRLGIDEAIGVARQALLALAEAHDAGIVHRDLKPDNLFLERPRAPGEPEICRVLDFGIATVPGEADEVRGVVGTPRYMAPEQAAGGAPGPRSDLYSLGVILYQMVVGRPPFADGDAAAVMAHHRATAPIPPRVAAPDAGIGEALSAVILRALAKRPEDRPASARALLADLDRAAARDARGRPKLRAVVLATAGALGAALVRTWRGEEQLHPERGSRAAPGPSATSPTSDVRRR